MSDEQTSQTGDAPENVTEIPDGGDPFGIGIGEADDAGESTDIDGLDAFDKALADLEGGAEAEPEGEAGKEDAADDAGEADDKEETKEDDAAAEDGEKAAADAKEGDEAATDAETKEEPKEPAFDVMAALRQEAPSAVVDKVEDLPKYVADLQERIMAYRKFEDAYDKSTYYQEFTKLVLEGVPEAQAVLKAFKPLLNAPDPDEDPEGRAEWEKNLAVLAAEEKAEEKARAEKASRDQQLAERREQMWTSQFDALAKENEWDDAAMQAEAQKINTLILGDPITGALPAGTLKRLHQAVHMDKVLAEKDAEHTKALEAEFKRGKAAGIESVRSAKTKGPSVPEFEGGGGEGELTDEQKEYNQLLKDIGVLDDPRSDFEKMVDKAFG